jgi:SAM-dependent methyltransferase
VDTGLTDAKRVFASAYDETATRFSEHADRLVYTHLATALHDAIGDAGPVLDVASGSGAVARQHDDAVAVDLSAGQLGMNPVTRRVHGDAEALPFRADAFAVAACAFGVNHFPDPAAAVREMARVAPRVVLLTWARPEIAYAPKEIVLEIVRRRTGSARTAAGLLADQLSAAVGSRAAVTKLLEGATLRTSVEIVTAEVPWPGAQAFVEYRLATISAAGLADLDALRAEAIAAVAGLPPAELSWRPRLVLGVGERRGVGLS